MPGLAAAAAAMAENHKSASLSNVVVTVVVDVVAAVAVVAAAVVAIVVAVVVAVAVAVQLSNFVRQCYVDVTIAVAATAVDQLISSRLCANGCCCCRWCRCR